jgi:hypothetical protein
MDSTPTRCAFYTDKEPIVQQPLSFCGDNSFELLNLPTEELSFPGRCRGTQNHP